MNVKKEMRRIIRDALVEEGGTGGRRHCDYCGRESYKGQVEHHRVDVEGETDEHCIVTVLKAALKESH